VQEKSQNIASKSLRLETNRLHEKYFGGKILIFCGFLDYPLLIARIGFAQDFLHFS